MSTFRESDLFPPIKTWLEAGGYTVHAEVNHCDIAARRGDGLVIIEMKRAVTLELLLQAVERQRAHASVYVAVPRPAAEDKRWRALTRLLKRLELGLLVVALESAQPRVELRFHPVAPVRQRRRDVTRALLAEMDQRTVNQNVGGATRMPVMTAYREQALAIAVVLSAIGPAAPRALKKRGTSPKTGDILHDNHYGWFERLAKGIYGLSPVGREALARYPDLVAALQAKLDPQPDRTRKTDNLP